MLPSNLCVFGSTWYVYIYIIDIFIYIYIYIYISPTPTFINEADIRRDFVDFARKMRCKWFFRNGSTEDFGEIPALRIKSNWSPPKGHSALDMFLSQMEGELFSLLPGNSTSYTLLKRNEKP